MATSNSRVSHFREGYGWENVAPEAYKAGYDEGRDWQGIVRQVLIGKSGETTAFHVRYFEVAPRGYSSLEKHGHAHVVIVVKGQGRAILNATAHEVKPFDMVYVDPWTPHQFQAAGDEPFGFLCIVDAERDRPQPVSETEAEAARTANTIAGQ